MARFLAVPQHTETDNNGNPVQVVRDNGTNCCRVLPAKEGIEDSPPSTTADLGITALVGQLASSPHGADYLAGALTLTCQTLFRISYEPGPDPVSAASPPMILFHCQLLSFNLSWS